MPNDLHIPETPANAEADVLGFLKGKDNPFDVFVTARQPDAEFVRWHVPALHREVLDPLIAVMERYRPAQLQTESDLPRSGMVVILGARGNGKTHTLLALREKLDAGPPRLLIAPVFYDPQRPFAEYLLHQILRHFEQEPNRLLHHLANALTRQVLVQALFSMTDVQWLARHTRGRIAFWKHLLGWGTGKLTHTKRRLIQDLDVQRTISLPDLCRQHELRPAILHRLALQHLEKCEAGKTVLDLVRRGLYQHLINLAFDKEGNADALFEFLFDGYTRLEAKNQPTRTELVDALIETLFQLCMLARLPVLFAFDALEALLGDPPRQEICEPFFHGVANFCDAHRGVAFLFFAETGHWQRAEGYMSHFARQRFEQGVIRVPQFGTVSRLILAPMTRDKLIDVIAARVRPLLTEYFSRTTHDLPPLYPFTDEDMKAILGSSAGLPLRLALQALRDRYDQRVYGTKAPPAPVAMITTAPPPAAAMEEHWQQQLREVKRNLVNLSGAVDELHNGIQLWLQSLIATETETPVGRPTLVRNETLGQHPSYGQVTSFQALDADEKVQEILGVLLGVGPGMKSDLETKLKIAATRNGTLNQFVILWPKGSDLLPPIDELLPPATREVWQLYAKKGVTQKVSLKAINEDMLHPWLALPRWLNKVKTEVEGATDALIHRFIVEHTRDLLPLLQGGK